MSGSRKALQWLVRIYLLVCMIIIESYVVLVLWPKWGEPAATLWTGLVILPAISVLFALTLWTGDFMMRWLDKYHY